MEITLSLVAGYALWIVGDEMLGVSGMLALVFFGGFMGAYGKIRVSRSVTTSFDYFWQWVDWIANTLIFFLTGLIIALELSKFETITGEDWGWAVALWLMLLAVRAIMVVLFFPILRLGQYGTTWKDAVILTWAGLRGAVGLTLGLIIYYSDDVIDAAYREHFLFLIAFIAFITLIVQGSTTSLLLKGLGYMHLSPMKQLAMLRAARAVDLLSEKKIDKAKKAQSLLGAADWDKVSDLSGLRLSELITKRPVGKKSLTMLKRSKARSHGAEKKDEEESVADFRERLLAVVLALYRDAFANEYVTPDENFILEESVDHALDELHHPLTDWTALERKLAPLEGFNGKTTVMQRIVPWWCSQDVLARRDASLCAAFACAHASARQEMLHFARIEFGIVDLQAEGQEEGMLAPNTATNHAKVSSLDKLSPPWREGQGLLHDASTELLPSPSTLARASTLDKGRYALTKDVLLKVIDESREEQALAEAHLQVLKERCPRAVENLRTTQVAMEILKQECELLEELENAGLLEEKEVQPVLANIERRLQMLTIINK